MNRTLARSMLRDSHLPPMFWAEALSTVVFIFKMAPSQVILQEA